MTPGGDVLEPGDLFAPRREFAVSWRQPLDVDGVADRVASVSFIAALSDGDRAKFLDQVREVAAATPPPLAMTYVAEVFAFTRVG
jgi:hypothetical protein